MSLFAGIETATNKLDSKPWIRPVGESYLASALAILSIATGIGYTGSATVYASAGLGMIPALVVFLYYSNIEGAYRRFFGLSDDLPINLVPSTYKNRVEYNPHGSEDQKFRYYKVFEEKKVFSIGPPGYVTGFETATSAILSAVALGRLTKMHVAVLGDEESLAASVGPVICLGSPTSNNVTAKALEPLPQSITIKFTPETLTCWLSTQAYRSTKDTDYAALVKTIDHQDRTYFVCAGIDGEGTVAVARHLVSEWKNLPKSPFIRIYECDKQGKSIKRKIGGQYLDRQSWKSE